MINSTGKDTAVPGPAGRPAGEPAALPARENWRSVPLTHGSAAAERQRLAAALLPIMPGPHDEPRSTSWLAEQLEANPVPGGSLLWRCLNRLTHSGLLDRIHRGRPCYWRATPLLAPLLHALPDPAGRPLPTARLAQQLQVPAADLTAALAALAWCHLAEQLGSRHDPADLSWRRRSPNADEAAPAVGAITVVALIGSSQPESRTRQLTEAALDALTTTAAVHPGQQHVLELRPIGPAAGHLSSGSSRCSPVCPLETGETEDDRWLEVVRGADLLIAATPTYLGTYSGLLKLALDRLGPDGLTRTVAVVAAVEPADVQCTTATALTGVLQHLGAQLPASPLVLWGQGDPKRGATLWAAAHGDAIRRALAEHPTPSASPGPPPAGGVRKDPPRAGTSVAPAVQEHPSNSGTAAWLPAGHLATPPHSTSILTTGQRT